MATTLADLLIKLGVDTSDFQKNLRNAQKQLRTAFGSDAIDLSKDISVGFAGIAAAALGVGVASIKMASDMAATKKSFTTLIGNAQDAQQFLDDLTSFAAQTPFQLTGLTDASKKLLAFGFAAEDIIPIMSAIGDAAALLGVGQEGIDHITLAIGQMNAKGKVSADEMNQLAETGIPVWKMLADAIGTDIPTAMKQAETGSISGVTGINAILTGMQTKFKGGMAGMATEISGIWSNIVDNTESVMRKIGDAITDGLDLKTKLSGLSDALSAFATDVQNSGIKQAIIDIVPPELTAAIFVMAGALLGAAVPAMIAFAISAWAAVAPLIPFIAIGAAVGALAYEIWKNWEPLGELFSTLFSTISSIFSEAWDGIISVISPVWETVVSIISTAWNTVLSVTSAVFDAITPIVKAAALVIGAVLLAAATPVIAAVALLYAAWCTIADVADVIYSNWDKIGQYFSELWDGLVAEVTAVWDEITSYISGIVDGIVATITTAWDNVVTVTTDIFGGIFSTLSDIWYSVVSYISSALDSIVGFINSEWDTAVDLTNSVWNGITSKISEAWDSICRIVSDGVNWVLSKMQALLDLIGTALPDGLKNFVSTFTSGISKISSAASKISLFGGGATSQTSAASAGIDKTFTGLHNAASSAASGSGSSSKTSAADKEAKAYEKLEKQADKTGESIEKEWLSLTNTQMASLDNWYNDEIKKLDESKDANADYTTDRERLDEIYAAKAAKILQEQQKESNAVWDQAYEDVADYKKREALLLAKTDVEKQKIEIESNAEEEITKIQNKYRDLALDFAGKTDEMKLQQIEAWNSVGESFTLMVNGQIVDAKRFADENKNNAAAMKNTSVSFAELTQKEILLVNNETAQKLKDLKYDETLYKQKLDLAYAEGNISAYQSLYKNQQGLQQQDLAGKQAYMDTYLKLWKSATQTAQELWANAVDGMTDNLSSFLTDTFSFTSSIDDAWKDLGQNLVKTIVGIYAKMYASRIAFSLTGKTQNDVDAANTAAAQATATAATVSAYTARTAAATAYYSAVTAAQATSMTTQTTVASTAMATLLAASTAMAAAIAAAWAPAAAMVSLATMGANSEAAIAGMTAATLAATALAVPKMATGGIISGPGTGTSDSILAWVSAGESVLTAKATNLLGSSVINGLNNGQLQGFASGGIVASPTIAEISQGRYQDTVSIDKGNSVSTDNAGNGSSSPIITTNMYGDINTETDVDKVSKKIANKVKYALMGAS